MDRFVEIVNGPNFGWFSLAALGAILLAWVLSKSGILTIHTKYVSMGIQDKEHQIMRKQLIHAKQACEAFVQYIPRDDDFNEWRAKCVAEYVYDEMVDWIALNHIEDTDVYIRLRQMAVWNIILAHSEKPCHKSDEFREIVYKHVADDIKTFVRIRETA